MKKRVLSGQPGFLFALCFLAYTFSYFGRYNLSVCLDPMVSEGMFDAVFRGYISSAFLVCYGAGQFINGRLGVRISPKIMIAIGLAMSGTCNILMGLVSQRFLFLIIWGLNGYFTSMLWSPIIRIFSEWLEDDARVSAGANISLTIPIGMLCCYLITFVVLRFAAWRAVFLTCGSLLCIGALIWIFGMYRLRAYTEQMTALRAASHPEPAAGQPKKTLSLRIFISTALFAVAFAAFFNGTLKDAVISWVPQYLIDSFAISSGTASLISMLLPLFSVAGPYAAIFINKRFLRNELSTVGVMFAVSLLCHAGVLLLGTAAPAVTIVLISISMACMWGVNTMLLTFVPYHFGALGISAAVTGTLNCVAYIGSSGFTGIYNSAAHAFGWNTVVLLWVVMGLAGCALCFSLARLWGKRRPE